MIPVLFQGILMYLCWGFFFYVAMTGIKWPLWFKVVAALLWPIIVIFWITGIIKDYL